MLARADLFVDVLLSVSTSPIHSNRFFFSFQRTVPAPDDPSATWTSKGVSPRALMGVVVELTAGRSER